MWGNRHLTEGGYIFHNYTTVTVESKGTAVFIQTDKPVYKPQHRGRPPLANRSEGEGGGEGGGSDDLQPGFLFLSLVLIHVYTVTPDLRPVNDKVIEHVRLHSSDDVEKR